MGIGASTCVTIWMLASIHHMMLVYVSVQTAGGHNCVSQVYTREPGWVPTATFASLGPSPTPLHSESVKMAENQWF